MGFDDKLLASREVRLFPTQRIGSIREAELRATASFLAVARAVSEFGKRIVSLAGGPASKALRCYTEVPFKVGENGDILLYSRVDDSCVGLKVGGGPHEQLWVVSVTTWVNQPQTDGELAAVRAAGRLARSDGVAASQRSSACNRRRRPAAHRARRIKSRMSPFGSPCARPTAQDKNR